MIPVLCCYVCNLLLDYLYSDLHHQLSDHYYEELSQQVHHLCPFVDHQPVIILVG